MTNNYVNKLAYMSSPIVQNKVLNMRRYLLTNLKVNSFLHEINGYVRSTHFLLYNERS